METASFFNAEKWSDITLKFGDKEIKCHKMILASQSPYFETLLKDNSGWKVCHTSWFRGNMC